MSHDQTTPQRQVLSRRTLLVAGVALGSAGVVAGVAVVRSGAGALPAELADNLSGLPGVEQLRAIGVAVERAAPHRASVPDLAARIAPTDTPDPIQWCSVTPPTALFESVGSSSRLDFASGELVEVEGWRLARSEAALCALVARA